MTELTTKQIDARLTKMHSALVEKLGGQPFMEPMLSFSSYRVAWSLTLYRENGAQGYDLKTVYATSILKALDLADAFVAKMPAAHDMKQHEWQKKLAALIDEAHDLSLPNEVVDPLRASSQAMSENLLAAE